MSTAQTRARLLDSFMGEHRGHVETVRNLAANLETSRSCSPDLIGVSLRALHSLKGTGRLLDFALLARLAHAGEVLLLELSNDQPTPEECGEAAVWLQELAAALEDGLAVVTGSIDPGPVQAFLRRLEQRTGEVSVEANSTPPPGEERRRHRTAQISVTDLNRLVRDIDYLEQQSSRLQATIDRLRNLEFDLTGELRRDCKQLRQDFQNIGNRLREASRIVRQDSRRLVAVPAHDLLADIGPRARQLAHSLGKTIEFIGQGWDHEVELPLLQSLVEPLWHLLRNSIYHGIETEEERQSQGKTRVGKVWLGVERSASYLHLWVADDGRGLQLDRLRQVARERGLDAGRDDSALPFVHGLSTVSEVNEVAGRGLGMSAVRERVVELGGQIVHDPQWPGCRFELIFPQRNWDVSVAMIRCGAYILGLPTQQIRRLVYWESDLLQKSGTQILLFQDNQARHVVNLSLRLGLGSSDVGGKTVPLVEIGSPDEVAGYLLVDAFVGQRHVVVEPIALPDWPSGLLEGCCLLDDGEVGLILSPQFFAAEFASEVALPTALRELASERPRLLVVDDSATIRALHVSILQESGYDVLEAENGADAWQLLQKTPVDLIISDIQMPLLDGFGLLQKLRERPQWQEVPVILLTSLAAPEEQQKGLDLGADAYLLKQSFDQRQLLDTVGRLL